MTTLKLFYATNRNHLGPDRWFPTGYGGKFSADGMGNLRFGALTLDIDDASLAPHLERPLGKTGIGDGQKLADVLSKRVKGATIEAYFDPMAEAAGGAPVKAAKQGSKGMFSDLQSLMKKKSDVLIYIHGFNVSWDQAVGSALALQLMLQNQPGRDPNQDLIVVLFTWPSDGEALPWLSYKSDRREAMGSGEAVARAVLKVQDFLGRLKAKDDCGQDIHLLCHSMGNYVLQNALYWIGKHNLSPSLPRLFEHVFLCAPDVNDNVLEVDQPMGRLHEMARTVSVYHNRDDRALVISDVTKGNPERLGGTGAARPGMLHQKIHQIDCAPIVSGLVQHSYYLCGTVNADIRRSIDGVESDDSQRARERVANYNNVWKMKPAS